jgi:AcrR family transcriptional regulator
VLDGQDGRKRRKRQARKDQIAESAIGVLSALGYADTTLRDIAAGSGLSLGMLHYYFHDKIGLIIHCVRIYKRRFIEDINLALARANGREELIGALGNGLTRAVADDWRTHMLWYDIRAQAMFDHAFRPVVDEIEQALTGVVEVAARRLNGNIRPDIAYASLDGLFRFYLQRASGARATAPDQMAMGFDRLIRRLFCGPDQGDNSDNLNC